LRNKLNELGYRLRKVRKCQPLEKIPETNAIFEAVHRVNQAADRNDGVLRISLDTKATVKVGPFSRGGCNRQGATACDHDFQAQTTLTPFGILLPQTVSNSTYGSSGLTRW
jgi:hypothetical protein